MKTRLWWSFLLRCLESEKSNSPLMLKPIPIIIETNRCGASCQGFQLHFWRKVAAYCIYDIQYDIWHISHHHCHHHNHHHCHRHCHHRNHHHCLHQDHHRNALLEEGEVMCQMITRSNPRTPDPKLLKAPGNLYHIFVHSPMEDFYNKTDTIWELYRLEYRL